MKKKQEESKPEFETTLKQYVIVPYSPVQSKGKLASQVAHATFMALEKQRKAIYDIEGSYLPDQDDIITKWKNSGMCVIVLGCKDTHQLMGIAKYLEQWNVTHHLYIDEGHTEVVMGTPTALATGVLSEEYSWMFQKLELFKRRLWGE